MTNNARTAHIESDDVRRRKSGKRISRSRPRRLLKLENENENKIKLYTADQRSNEKKNALEGKAEIFHFLGIDVLLPLVHTHLFLLKSSLL